MSHCCCCTAAVLLPLLQYRWHVFKSIRAAIDNNEGGLDKFTQGGWGGVAVSSFVSRIYRTAALALL